MIGQCWSESDVDIFTPVSVPGPRSVWGYRLVTAVNREAAPPCVHTDWLVILTGLPSPQTVSSPGRGWLTAKLNWATTGRRKLTPGRSMEQCGNALPVGAKQRTGRQPHFGHIILDCLSRWRDQHWPYLKPPDRGLALNICGVGKISAFIPAPLSRWCDKSLIRCLGRDLWNRIFSLLEIIGAVCHKGKLCHDFVSVSCDRPIRKAAARGSAHASWSRRTNELAAASR